MKEMIQAIDEFCREILVPPLQSLTSFLKIVVPSTLLILWSFVRAAFSLALDAAAKQLYDIVGTAEDYVKLYLIARATPLNLEACRAILDKYNPIWRGATIGDCIIVVSYWAENEGELNKDE